MESLEAELERARELDVETLADAVESIGFECTRCGECCTADSDEAHTATVFPEEVRELRDERSAETADRESRPRAWSDVARPMPYGVDDEGNVPAGETFEWALQIDDCGDCVFYEERNGSGHCTAHEHRPLICRTYPFSTDVTKGDEPPTGSMGDIVDQEGVVRAHECEGLGRDIPRSDAVEMAEVLKERAIRELEEAIAVRDSYEPTDTDGIVVHDSEGQKRPDGTPINQET